MSVLIFAGSNIFNVYCRDHYPNGCNIIEPEKQIKDSKKLKDFDTSLSFVCKPIPPMLSFSQETMTDKQA